MSLPPSVCLLGPTGAGKTSVSLALAEEFGGAVINIDSRQVYRGLETVTAQPSSEEQASCPHHLFGFLDPCQGVNAGAFTTMAEQAMLECAENGLLPLLTGGTGLYLDALVYGLDPVPDTPDLVRHQIQAGYDALGPETMYSFLEQIDPDYAAKIHPNDRHRVTRALEVYESTGRVFSSFHTRDESQPRFDVLKIGLEADLDALTPKLEERIESMVRDGALDEVDRAFKECPDVNAPGFTGIGVHECLEYLRGRMDLDQAKAMWLKRTRAYAKRQMTWFRKEQDMRWVDPARPEQAVALVREWLNR
ncbi:tRNA (adenosine(37)-N6)-dimethylallyltransferase MiaA [Desulfohalovibrio reitneri]|uniref:tRNA (adenosine(37)-N6)-dimethylallyltransferase MiaA n=1 Tax=Desulfohalovibrio reitneri TaxID=1307759 RepID=UPI0004A727F8|nr:tRNA (adenosine(37)-N6)-dimethylallyltransferase MiaA [Desulfohalovibrio reitneri]